ncbi:MAG: 23S rRNA (uracil(1939)-C(5))-methyltransferase RlmD [Gammaproteobacteria bacterium]
MARRSSRRAKLPSEPVVLQIESLNHEGRGVAHRDGKVLFVEGALPGEQVQATYIRRRGQFDELRTDAVLQAGEQRVTPPCPVASRCGGCSLQHLQENAQLQFKQSVLLEKLLHATGVTADRVKLLPAIRSDGLHYRRKARLAVRVVASRGGALVGFREKHSSFITAMEDCPVLHPTAARMIAPLRQLICGLEASRHIPQIEVAVGELDEHGSGFRLALVLRHMAALGANDMATLLQFARTHDFDLYLQPSGVASVHKVYPESPAERLQYFLPDSQLRLQFHPLDFTQVNADVNRRIVARALQQLELSRDDSVLDLFCGIGNFTLAIARCAGRVLGVEGSDELVKRARDNAGLNAISNAEFHSANLMQPMASANWSQQSFNKLLLDPPRSGALEVVPQLWGLGVEKIVYVSCNPATLVRDAKLLMDAGYQLNSVGVMDMFPHTTHVESMAVFDRT